MKTILAFIATLTVALILSGGPESAQAAAGDQDWVNLRGRHISMGDSIIDRSDTSITYLYRATDGDTSWVDTIRFDETSCRYIISYTWSGDASFSADSTRLRIWPWIGSGQSPVWDYIISDEPYFQGDTTDGAWDGVTAVINTWGVLDSAAAKFEILDTDGVATKVYCVAYRIPCESTR